MNTTTLQAASQFTEHDVFLFKEGTHARLSEKLGAHLITHDGVAGVHFAVWAPNATAVSVIGDFNGWDKSSQPLAMRPDDSGVWEGFVSGIGQGNCYKYHITSRDQIHQVDKADPYGMFSEVPPRTGSRVWDLDYTWNDAEWMGRRKAANALDAPMSIYEVHLGSWRRVPEEGNRSLSYRELAPLLVEHMRDLGFTHVELLPVTEHPFFGSWGYQTTGYFAPTSRQGTPQDLMYLIDHLHQAGIGVILDWVPSHFPSDEHGLAYFDGTHLFEHSDPRQGFHPEWKSAIFNYGRNEVRAFLMSSALFWLDKYHIDGLRVDGVASMLYLDYGRKAGEWIPNEHGGRENLAAMSFLRGLNEAVYRDHPDTLTIAEESTAWPMVSRPTYMGGLGFGMKWNMGWMHDTLKYYQQDPMFRKYHHEKFTFSIWYAFTENFVLPMSHDEVVHGKGSLLGKMPGDEWQRFANQRLLLTYQAAASGKKLMFMGMELGQSSEWSEKGELPWQLLQYPLHAGMQRLVGDLNRLYAATPALHDLDFEHAGFSWIDCHDVEQSVVSWLRYARDGSFVAVVLNFTPVPRQGYRLGVPEAGSYRELFNSDSSHYGGGDVGNGGSLQAQPIPWMGRPASIQLTLPPLGGVILALVPEQG